MNNKKLKTSNIREDRAYKDVEQITFEIDREDSSTYIEISIPGIMKANIRTKLDPNNCKLAYIYNIERLLSVNALEDREKLIKNLLLTIFEKYAKRVIIYITVTRERDMNFIKNNFKCYFINMIPFGDDTGVQYHIAIMNERVLSTNSTLVNAINKNPVVNIHVFKEKNSLEVKSYFTKTKSISEGSIFEAGLMEQMRGRVRNEERRVEMPFRDDIVARPEVENNEEQAIDEDIF